MSDELQNKSGKVKVMYVHSDSDSDKRTHDLRTVNNKRKGWRPSSLRADFGSRSKYGRRGEGRKRAIISSASGNDISVKPDHCGSGKVFIDPEVLRRQRAAETRVYGENACQALFNSRPESIVRAWFIQSVTPRFKEALRWMAANHKAYHVIDEAELAKVSGTEHHGGVSFLIKKRNGTTVQRWINQASADDCVLALENVGNPHNLGAMMRSCAHFSVKGVLLQDTALLESGAAIRIAEGGAEHVRPITGNSVLEAIEQFRKAGYTIVTTTSHGGDSLFKVTLPRKMVLVLGQERDGLSEAALSSADLNISIDGTGNIESLNVSVATGILLAEWWRQNKA